MSYEYFSQVESKKVFEKFQQIVEILSNDKVYDILSYSSDKILLKHKDITKTYGSIQDIEIIFRENKIFIVIYNATGVERNNFIKKLEQVLDLLGISCLFEED